MKADYSATSDYSADYSATNMDSTHTKSES